MMPRGRTAVKSCPGKPPAWARNGSRDVALGPPGEEVDVFAGVGHSGGLPSKYGRSASDCEENTRRPRLLSARAVVESLKAAHAQHLPRAVSRSPRRRSRDASEPVQPKVAAHRWQRRRISSPTSGRSGGAVNALRYTVTYEGAEPDATSNSKRSRESRSKMSASEKIQSRSKTSTPEKIQSRSKISSMEIIQEVKEKTRRLRMELQQQSEAPAGPPGVWTLASSPASSPSGSVVSVSPAGAASAETPPGVRKSRSRAASSPPSSARKQTALGTSSKSVVLVAAAACSPASKTRSPKSASTVPQEAPSASSSERQRAGTAESSAAKMASQSATVAVSVTGVGGIPEVVEGDRQQVKEALSRLLLERKKELLRLQMQAKEKQLAELRRGLERKAAASTQQKRRPPPHCRGVPPPGKMAKPSKAAAELELRMKEHKKKLDAAIERRNRLAAAAALQAAAAQAAEVGRANKRMRVQEAKEIHSISPASTSPRSISVSAGGASEDSEVQRRWRKQEAASRQSRD